jgi:hypothetical protein
MSFFISHYQAHHPFDELIMKRRKQAVLCGGYVPQALSLWEASFWLTVSRSRKK